MPTSAFKIRTRSFLMRYVMNRKQIGKQDSFTQILNYVVKNTVRELGNKVAEGSSMGLKQRKEGGAIRERSYNLIDSIGACIVVNGTISDENMLFARQEPKSNGVHKGWEREDIESNTGRGYLMSYFESLKKDLKGTKGFRVYIVAAAYYAQILEDGTQTHGGRTPDKTRPLGTKYKIISFGKDMLEDAIDVAVAHWNSANFKNGLPLSATNGRFIKNLILRDVGSTYAVSGIF